MKSNKFRLTTLFTKVKGLSADGRSLHQSNQDPGFPRRGANSRGGGAAYYFAKCRNYMEMEEFGPRGGARSLRPPPGSASSEAGGLVNSVLSDQDTSWMIWPFHTTLGNPRYIWSSLMRLHASKLRAKSKHASTFLPCAIFGGKKILRLFTSDVRWDFSALVNRCWHQCTRLQRMNGFMTNYLQIKYFHLVRGNHETYSIFM